MKELLTSTLGDALEKLECQHGEWCVWVSPANIKTALTLLRNADALRFATFIDICGVDYLGRTPRFDVVYHLLSMRHNLRIRVKVMVEESTLVPSVVDIFPAAGWFEREAWDLFGLKFAGNPDLRRILTDYGFEGHPLRKDFPLTGHVEVRYDPERGQVVYEPVKLAQDYRTFDFESPWEGMQHNIVLRGEGMQHNIRLPGDEKASA